MICQVGCILYTFPLELDRGVKINHDNDRFLQYLVPGELDVSYIKLSLLFDKDRHRDKNTNAGMDPMAKNNLRCASVTCR